MKDDEIDALILKHLLKDGRKNFIEIAKECGTTKDVIWKHYRKMEKKGIIVGSTIQFNYASFGYGAVASILLNVASQNVNVVLENLNKIPGILVERHYLSSYNVGIIALVRTFRDFDQIKERIRKENPILDFKTYIWIDVRNIPENIIATAFTNKADKIDEASQLDKSAFNTSVKLDEIDMQIVEKLTKNGRASFRKIAQEIGISPGSVSRRYEKLKKNNYLKVSIQVNPAKLGYCTLLHFVIHFTEQVNTEPIVKKLTNFLGVTYLVKMIGDCELLVAVLVRDVAGVFAFYDELLGIQKIGKIEVMALPGILSPWPGPQQYISTF
jgi:Lrp/AsnC family transcriptional regulator for asnA, asnC and gidA